MKQLSLMIIVLLIVGCEGKPKPKIEETFKPQKKKAEKVEVIVLQKRPFVSLARYPGSFKEWDAFSIAPELGGKIDYMPYNTNDFIKKGASVVRINTATFRAQMKQLKVSQDIALTNFKRTQKLFQKGLATQAQMDQVIFQKSLSKANINALNVTLRKSTIYSPFNGHVATRFKQKGELANPGQPIVNLIQLDPIKFIVPIPERDIYKLAPGNVVTINLPATQKNIKGIVYKIAQVANRSSHTVNVEIEIENPKEYHNYIFKPGMFAKMELPLTRRQKAFVIPLDSIIRTEKESLIFIEREKKAIKIIIDTVATNENEALVSGDIKQNDRLIIKGQHNLVNNQIVNSVKTTTPDLSRFNYKKAIINCPKNKAFKDIRAFARKLLKEEITVYDFFRNNDHYTLIYKGELSKALQGCIPES